MIVLTILVLLLLAYSYVETNQAPILEPYSPFESQRSHGNIYNKFDLNDQSQVNIGGGCQCPPCLCPECPTSSAVPSADRSILAVIGAGPSIIDCFLIAVFLFYFCRIYDGKYIFYCLFYEIYLSI
jgi:hypothetical protein